MYTCIYYNNIYLNKYNTYILCIRWKITMLGTNRYPLAFEEHICGSSFNFYRITTSLSKIYLQRSCEIQNHEYLPTSHQWYNINKFDRYWIGCLTQEKELNKVWQGAICFRQKTIGTIYVCVYTCILYIQTHIYIYIYVYKRMDV